MTFKNITNSIKEAFFDKHYYCDFLELNTIPKRDTGLNEDNIVTLLEYQRDEAGVLPDSKKGYIDDLFAMLNERALTYGEQYPFVVAANNTLTIKADLTEKHKLYLFFLFCSRTERIECRSNLLESDFEYVSKIAFKKYLPTEAQVHGMGKSSCPDQTYTGTITQKIDAIAKDLKTNTIYTADMFSDRNTGDGGLDLIAWLPFFGDHDYRYIQLYIAQCATGKDWLGKQEEPENLVNYIQTPKGTITTLFIPYDGRNSSGIFHHRAKIRAPLIFDRRRMINMFGNDELGFIAELESYTDVILPAIQLNIDILE